MLRSVISAVLVLVHLSLYHSVTSAELLLPVPFRGLIYRNRNRNFLSGFDLVWGIAAFSSGSIRGQVVSSLTKHFF